MSKYSKFKKRPKLEGPLSVGTEKYTRESLTNGQKGAEAVFDKWFKMKKKSRQPILRIGGGSGSGKAQPGDTPIPTPTGMKLLKDLRVGDWVFNMNGNPVPILGIYSQGVQDTYEITFHDGRTTRCNLKHLWYARPGSGSDLHVMSLEDILEYHTNGETVTVPRPGTAMFDLHKADGAYGVGLIIGKDDHPDAYIPDKYKYNGLAYRQMVLWALTSKTVGRTTVDMYSYVIRVSFCSKRLVMDIADIVRSMGYDATVSDVIDHYCVNIRCPVDKITDVYNETLPDEFNDPETVARWDSWYKDELVVTDIKKVDPTPQLCIYIADPLHVYLTENYIPTHNTHFLKYLVDKYGWDRSECYVISYTGQSVNVLRNYGLISTTIHSAFMIPQEEPILDKYGEPIVRRGIPLTTVKFRPIPHIPPSVQLIIVDESSFLPESLEKTLLRYNVPIFEIGDPIQLPPVGGKQVFHMGNLDYFIEGVMRQNADSEIYKLGTAFRHGEPIDLDAYGREVQFLHQQASIEETFYMFYPIFRAADLIVTSTNKQRQVITDLYRKEIVRSKSPYPRAGEKMICRKNNQTLSLGDFILANGTRGVCLNTVGNSLVDKSTKTFCMDFKPDVVAGSDLFYDNLICDADFLQQPFGTNSMTSFQHLGEKFEYAYAITTHLIQGGSAPTVIFMDSFNRDQEYLNRLRYTAATRATEKLYYMVPYRGEWSLSSRGGYYD